MNNREKLIASDLLSIKAIFLRPDEPLHGQVELKAQFTVTTVSH